jgi:3-oxoisoapionate decarboxylase
MHLGLSTYTCPWAIALGKSADGSPFTATELIELTARKALKRVQLCDNLPRRLHDCTAATLEGLRTQATADGIQIEVGTNHMTRDNLLRYADIAHFFQSPFLRMVIDGPHYEPSVSEVIDVIGSVLPDFKAANVVLALENHDRFSARDLAHIIQSTDSGQVGICLDTANSFGAGEGLMEVVPVLAPFTVNLHVKDFAIRRVPHKMGFIINGCAAGAGMLNLPKVLEQLSVYDHCQSVTLEIWSDPLESAQANLQQEHEWIEQSLDYLSAYF